MGDRPVSGAAGAGVVIFTSFNVFMLLILIVIVTLDNSSSSRGVRSIGASLETRRRDSFAVSSVVDSRTGPRCRGFSSGICRRETRKICARSPRILTLRRRLETGRETSDVTGTTPGPGAIGGGARGPGAGPTPRPRGGPTTDEFFSKSGPRGANGAVRTVISNSRGVASNDIVGLIALRRVRLPGKLLLSGNATLFNAIGLSRSEVGVTVRSIEMNGDVCRLGGAICSRSNLPNVCIPLGVGTRTDGRTTSRIINSLGANVCNASILDANIGTIDGTTGDIFHGGGGRVIIAIGSGCGLCLG